MVAGAEECDRRVVIDGFGVHRPDDAKVVGDFACVTHEVAIFRAALSIFLEIRESASEWKRRLVSAHAGKTLALSHRVRQGLAVLFPKQRLRVEGLKLRRPAGLEKVDDAFRFGREVRAFGERCCVRIADEAAHGQSAYAQRRGAEEMAPCGLYQAIVARLRGMHGD